MNKQNRRIPMIILVSVLLVSQALTPLAATKKSFSQQSQETLNAKLVQFFKQGNFTVQKVADNGWVVDAKSNAMPTMKMIIATAGNLLIIGTVLVQKKDMKYSQDLLVKLLKMNHEYDLLKVGIDDDDDLFIRLEMDASRIDFQQFKVSFDGVVTTVDKVYTEIKPFLNAK